MVCTRTSLDENQDKIKDGRARDEERGHHQIAHFRNKIREAKST